VNWKLTILPAIAVLFLAGVCFAGLGEPLAKESDKDALSNLKSSEVYRNALELLKEKGYSQEQADSALAKLPPEQLALLGTELPEPKAGGYYELFWIDFLFFCLFVGLIVWLIMVLIEAETGRYYGRRPRYYR
jgi:hypothetical protein